MGVDDPLKYADKDKRGKVTGFAHEVFKRTPVANGCTHEEFETDATVTRLEDQKPMVFMLDIKVKCTKCGAPFRFVGLPGGLNFKRPMCSADAHEARLPIEPSSELSMELATEDITTPR